MPSLSGAKDLLFRIGTRLHAELYQRTGGRIGGSGFGMPVVILRTVGRRTGKVRETVLTSPVQIGDSLVLVASYGGDRRHPAWFLNLRETPEVEVTIRGRTRRMRARVATPQERAELWPRVTQKFRGYAAYQRRTDRQIPLVLLDPAPSP